jgi:hypothetical protein
MPACRCCGLGLTTTIADLGMAPLRASPAAGAAEPFEALRLMVCDDCRLVQLPSRAVPIRPAAPWEAPSLAASLVGALRLEAGTPVAELGAGAMLPAFAPWGMAVQRQPARGFGAAVARRLRAAAEAPVVVLVPDAMGEAPSLHALAAGLREWLAPGGVAVLDVPSLQSLVEGRRIEMIRHGRLNYFTLATAEMVLAQHGLVIFDAQPTRRGGGGLRLLARHAEDRAKPLRASIETLRAEEAAAGLGRAEAYRAFAEGIVESKCALLDFLVGMRRAGLSVAAAGVPDSTTLLTYAGVGPELLAFASDDDPSRQGVTLPGTRIPIRAPEAILRERPDFLLCLTAAPRAELARRHRAIRDWGGRLAVPSPIIEIF